MLQVLILLQICRYRMNDCVRCPKTRCDALSCFAASTIVAPFSFPCWIEISTCTCFSVRKCPFQSPFSFITGINHNHDSVTTFQIPVEAQIIDLVRKLPLLFTSDETRTFLVLLQRRTHTGNNTTHAKTRHFPVGLIEEETHIVAAMISCVANSLMVME
ncbi:hypothetical protein ACS0TY_026762 [Phlomoides rotata]